MENNNSQSGVTGKGESRTAEKENKTPDTVDTSSRSDVIDFGDILKYYLHNWWLFVIFLALCIGAGVFYVKKKSPVYLVQGMIMLNQQEAESSGPVPSMSALISSMGFGSGGGVNPENEQLKMLTNVMMQEIVDTLQLNTSYWQNNGFFKRRVNYYRDEPITVSVPEQVRDTLGSTTIFTLSGPVNGPWMLKTKQGKEDIPDVEVTKLPYEAKTPHGTFLIDRTCFFPKSGDLNVSAIYMSNVDAIEWLKDNIAVNYVSNKADALQIDMGDQVIDRAKDIVNTMMDIYNDKRESDRLEYNRNLLEFIDNRLLTLIHELESSETKIEKYRKEHKVVSADAEAQYIFARKGAVEESTVALQANIQILEMLQQMLTSTDMQYSMIPFSGTGVQGMSEGYTKLIDNYNNLVSQRMTLASSAKPGNTALEKLDAQINATRSNILASISKELQSARINLKSMQAEQKKSDSRMDEIPGMEHELITLYRDREVQNTIYAFLLQKREETQIALSKGQPVGKIVDPAYCNGRPVKPKPMLIYIACIVAGLGIPVVILQLRRRKKK
ncbi:MAG: hypothetical protein NC548_47735 [Lachnospiraceae bacterium]|nr:hypothetical protein [Prevotella sp.]MCM1074326.1 hypothetical protein [Ruminococcus sp.]MCM1222188.1 hypothetical protein [Lachnospiraceae bacterium]